ncbi:Ankyrin repeat domain-containing protein 7 [Rhizophlyctis rosea]|nr:Ankyrin repeat domain-containing protein 7 [Rhizophlyctis rosea]
MRKLSLRKSTASASSPIPNAGTETPTSEGRASVNSTHSHNILATSNTSITTPGSRFSFPISRKRSNSVKSTHSTTTSVDSSRASLSNISIPGLSSSASHPPPLPSNTTLLTLTPTQIYTPTPINTKKLNSLQEAVYKDDVKAVQKLMEEKKRDVNKLDTYHRFTALHVASMLGREECARMLLKGVNEGGSIKRANPNMTDQDGRTPLMVSVMTSHIHLTRLLLDYGASVDITDNLDCVALHYAVLTGDNVAFNMLMSKNPKLNGVDKSGNPLLHHAIRLNRQDMATDLINKGHYVNAVNSQNQTPLHLSTPSPPLTRLLLQKGADPTMRDNENRKPIDYIHDATSTHPPTASEQEIIDLLTLKELAKEAREQIVKRDFLGGSEGDLLSDDEGREERGEVEETEVEVFDGDGGLGIEYEKGREKGKGREGGGRGRVQGVVEESGSEGGDGADDGDDSPLDLSEALSSSSDSDVDSVADDDFAMRVALGLPKEEKKAKKDKPLKKRRSIIQRDTSLQSIGEQDTDPLGRTESELSIGAESLLGPGEGKKGKEVHDVTFPAKKKDEDVGRRVVSERVPLKDAPSPTRPPHSDDTNDDDDDLDSDILEAIGGELSERSEGDDLITPASVNVGRTAALPPPHTAQMLPPAQTAQVGLPTAHTAQVGLPTSAVVTIPRAVSKGDEIKNVEKPLPPTRGENGSEVVKVDRVAQQAIGSLRSGEQVKGSGAGQAVKGAERAADRAVQSQPIMQYNPTPPPKLQEPQPPPVPPKDTPTLLPPLTRPISDPTPAEAYPTPLTPLPPHLQSELKTAQRRSSIHVVAPVVIARPTSVTGSTSFGTSDRLSGADRHSGPPATHATLPTSVQYAAPSSPKPHRPTHDTFATTAGIKSTTITPSPIPQTLHSTPPQKTRKRSTSNPSTPPPYLHIPRPPLSRSPSHHHHYPSLSRSPSTTSDSDRLSLGYLSRPSSSLRIAETNDMLKDLEVLMRKYAGQEEIEDLVAVLGKVVRGCRGMVKDVEGEVGRFRECWGVLLGLDEGEGKGDEDEEGAVDVERFKRVVEGVRRRHEDTVTELEEKVKASEETSMGLEENVKDLESKATGLEEKIVALESQLTKKDKALSEARNLVGENETALTKAGEVVKRLKVAEDGVRSRDEEIRKLRESGERREGVVRELESKISGLEAKSKESENQLLDRETTITALRTSLEKQTDRAALYQKELNDSEQREKALMEAVEDTQDELRLAVSHRDRQITDLNADVSDLQSQLAKVKSEISDIESARDAARREVEDLEEEVGELEGRVKEEKEGRVRLEETIAELKHDVEVTLGEKERLDGEVKKLKEALRSKEKEMNEEIAQREKSESLNVKLQGMLDLVKDQNASNAQALESKNQQVESIRTQLRDLTVKHSEVSTERKEGDLVKEEVVSYYEREIRMLMEEMSEEKRARLAREGDLEKLLESVGELEAGLEEVKRLYEREVESARTRRKREEELSTECEGLRKAAAEGREKVKELEVKGVRERARIEEVEGLLSGAEGEVEKLRKEREVLVSERDGLKVEVGRLEGVCKELEARVEEFERESSEIDKIVEGLGAQNEGYKRELEERAETITKLMSEAYEARQAGKRIKELEVQLGKLEEERDFLNEELQEAKTHLDAQTREIHIIQSNANRDMERSKSEVTNLRTQMQRLEQIASVRDTKDEAASSSATKMMRSMQSSISELQQALEREREKNHKYQKATASRDALMSKLNSSIADMAVASSIADLRDRDLPTRKIFSLGSLTHLPTNLPLPELLTTLRTTVPQGLRDIEVHLTTLEETLSTELRTITSIHSALDAEAEFDGELTAIMARFFDLQTTRFRAARGMVGEVRDGVGEFKRALEGELQKIEGDVVRAGKGLEEKVGVFKDDRDRLKEEVGMLERKVKEVEKRSAEVNRVKGKLEEEIKGLKEEKGRQKETENEKSLKKRVKELEKELKGLERRDRERSRSVRRDRSVGRDRPPSRSVSPIRMTAERGLERGLQVTSQLAEAQAAKEALLTRSLELEEQLRETETNLDSSNTYIKQLQQTEASLRQHITDLETSIKAKDLEIIRANSQLAVARRDHQSEVEALQDERNRLKRTLKSATAQQSEAQEALKQALAQSAETEMIYKRQRMELEQTILSLRHGRSAGDVEQIRLAEELKLKEAAFERATAEADELQKAKVRWESEKTVLEEQVARKEAVIKKLGIKHATAESDKLQKANAQWEVEKSALEEQIARKDAVIKKLEVKIQSLGEKHATGESEKLQKANVQWEFEKTMLEEQVARKEGVIKKLEVKIQSLGEKRSTEESAELQKANWQWELEKTMLEEQVARKEGVIKKLQVEIQSLGDKREDVQIRLQEQLKHRDAAFERVTADLEELKNAKVQWEVEKTVLEEQVARKEGEIKKLGAEIQSLGGKRGELQMKLEEQLKLKQSALDRASLELDELQKAKVRWEVEKTGLEERVERKEGIIKRLGVEIQSLGENRGDVNMRLQEQLKLKETALERASVELEEFAKAKVRWEVEKTVLEEQVARKDGMIKKMGVEIQSLGEKGGDVDIKWKGAELEVSKLEAALRKAVYDAEIANGERERCEAEKRKIEEELEKRTLLLVQKKKELDVVRMELEQVHGWVTALQGLQDGADGGGTIVVSEDGKLPPSVGKSISKLQKDCRFAQERVATLELQITLERTERADLERRSVQMRKNLEQDVSSLSKTRDHLEDRVAFLENQRRVAEMRISDLMDAVANANEVKLHMREVKEKLFDAESLVERLRKENTELQEHLVGGTAKATVAHEELMARLKDLEAQNTRLSALLQTANTTLEKTTAQATANRNEYDAQIRQLSARLNNHARERERVEKTWLRNTGEMVRGYEDEIRRLMEEVKKLRETPPQPPPRPKPPPKSRNSSPTRRRGDQIPVSKDVAEMKAVLGYLVDEKLVGARGSKAVRKGWRDEVEDLKEFVQRRSSARASRVRDGDVAGAAERGGGSVRDGRTVLRVSRIDV